MTDSAVQEVVDQAQALIVAGQDVHAIVDGFDQNLPLTSIAMSGAASVRLGVSNSAAEYIIRGDRLIGIKAAPGGGSEPRITGF